MIKTGGSSSSSEIELLRSNSNMPQLPLQSTDDVMLLEECLENPSEVALLTQDLSNLGGNKLNTIVITIVKALFTKAVALGYSLKGMGKKNLSLI